MTWWTATNVAINNGQSIVNVTTGDDVQIAQESGGIIIGNNPPVEIKRTFLDGSGNKKIELRLPWPYSNVTSQSAVAFPTDADLAEATRVLRAVGSDAVTFAEALAQVIGSTANSVNVVTETSGTLSVVPYGKLTQQVQDLLNVIGDFGSPLLSSTSQNDARNRLGLAPRITAQPTLDLDFTKGNYRVYEPFGLTKKPLTEAITTTRNSAASYNSPFGVANANANIPRIEYDPATGEALGLLCEEQRTNLFLWSEDFSNAAWSKTLVDTPSVSLIQGTNFTRVQATTSGEAERFIQQTTSIVSGVQSFSFKVKPEQVSNLVIRLNGTGFSDARVRVNLTTLETGSNTTATNASTLVTVKNENSDVLKVTVTFNAPSSGAFSVRYWLQSSDNSIGILSNFNAGDGIWLSAAQLEAGSFPTSYIKTEGSQVTRTWEYFRAFSIQQTSEITIAFDIFDRIPNNTPSGRNATIFSLNDGSSNNRLTLRRDPGTTVNLLYHVDGTSVGIGVSLFNRNGFNRVAIKVTTLGVVSIFINGVFSNTATHPNSKMIPFNRLDIGNDRELSFSRYDGVYRNFKVRPRALSDQELIDLTKL